MTISEVVLIICKQSFITLIHFFTFKLIHFTFNPFPAKFIYLNFHPVEVVSRYRNPQLQVGENY